MARVLVVDDDDQVRELFSLGLKHQGHDVTPTGSGTEAMKLVRRGKFDVLVTDLVMPDTEGMEIIMTVRDLSIPIKIIAVSGGGTSGNNTYLDAAKRLGADLTLSKPVSASRLAEAVKIVLTL